jgi:hypothetical protein
MTAYLKEEVLPMARQAHLDAAKHHIDAACKHLAAAGKHHDGDHEEGERCSREAQILSRIADDRSTEAYCWSTAAANKKLA